MTVIAKILGNGWDTVETEWHGPFSSEKVAVREMTKRFPGNIRWHHDVVVKKIIVPRKLHK